MGIQTRKLESLSCIVPALNEYDNLVQLLPKIQEVLGDVVPDLKIILVDDGSTDKTPLLFDQFKDQIQLQYIQFSRNFGKESAIAAGLKAVTTQAAVILDADFQHPPELINQMIESWAEGYDMVYTYRENREDESALKKLGSDIFYKLFFNTEMPRNAGDFRLMDISVVQAINKLSERRRFTKGLYHWVGFNTKAIPYVPAERKSGKSRFNFLKLSVLAVDGITSFSVKPLRLSLIIGLILSIFGFTYMTYIIIYWFLFDVLKGFTTVVVLICAMFGMLFLILGVLGEYIGKIFEEVKERPIFIVQQNRLSPSLMHNTKYHPDEHHDLATDAIISQSSTLIIHNEEYFAQRAKELAQKQAELVAQQVALADELEVHRAQQAKEQNESTLNQMKQSATNDVDKNINKDSQNSSNSNSKKDVELEDPFKF